MHLDSFAATLKKDPLSALAKGGSDARFVNHYVLSPGGVGIAPHSRPPVLYILTRSAAQGRRAGLASVGGIELASLTHAVAATFGLSALLLTSALAFSVVKYLGAAYLIYLGVRTLLSRHESHQTLVPTPKSFSRLFAQGFLVNLLNPKTALFFYAFLPQFVDPARGAVIRQIPLFGGCSCCWPPVRIVSMLSLDRPWGSFSPGMRASNKANGMSREASISCLV